jgi:hypothetical protein
MNPTHKIYVINLTRRADRRKEMEKELARVQLAREDVS